VTAPVAIPLYGPFNVKIKWLQPLLKHFGQLNFGLGHDIISNAPMGKTYTFITGDMPLVACAIHEGHDVRSELEPLFALNEEERLREEDPFTAYWVGCTNNQIVVQHSRFEVDVNRPPDKAVYQRPEDAWGLQVWKNPLPSEVVQRSLDIYNRFYTDLKKYFDGLFEIHPRLIVYDIHSYNHRRVSKDIIDSEEENPEINLGTKNINHQVWRPVIDTMLKNFRAFYYAGHSPEARGSIGFVGG
jgi:hypothetical protein